jgi:drug/metabolite transporter (DMT)-like permease
VAILLGLAAAVTYGAADFLGGLATKTTRVFSVVLLSQLLGSLFILVALPFFADIPITGDALLWGGLSGVAGATGVAFFYQGLSVGRMSIIAPITAVIAASVPVVFGLVTGDRPGSVALAGVVVTLVAVALISSSPDRAPDAEQQSGRPRTDAEQSGRPRTDAEQQSGLAHAQAAGLAFGAFFILLSRAGDDTGLWPLVGARFSSLTVIGVAILVTRSWDTPNRTELPAIAGAGVFDVLANLFYLLASREGLLSVVAVLTSMYPASTVLLARVVLKERFAPTQMVGLAVAVAGVVAIGFG